MSRASKKKRQKKRAPAKAGNKSPSSPIYPSATSLQSRRTILGICALLAIMVFLVFGQTARHGFVFYDDDEYVFENPIVANGLTVEGVKWAFTSVHSNNWHPLTWMSHMLDCEIYGLNAGGHHVTSVLLHAATVILLFLVLCQMTSSAGRTAGYCAFVAAVFAIHPLRVESVAWVAERKDVLSGLFFMLTLMAYTRFATKPFSLIRYLWVLLFFALGLMSKPMLVTLPFVLLLLDYWPLHRLPDGGLLNTKWKMLISEKLPLLALSAASCAVTILAQQKAMQPLEQVSLLMRAGNALVAYVVYLWQSIYPANLAVLYPIPANGWPVWQVIAAAVLLCALTAWAFVQHRNRPYLLVGWLWYLGILVPVIGIVHVGNQAYADRYTYLPQIGLVLAATWGAAEWAGSKRQRCAALAILASAILCILLIASARQTSYWRDSIALWTHTLGCTRNNEQAHNNIGVVLIEQGKTEEAISQFREAVKINPAYIEAHYNLGNAMRNSGNAQEAITQFREALRLDPSYFKAHNNLGAVMLDLGRLDEAAYHFERALELHPSDVVIQSNLAWVLAITSRVSLRDGNRALQLAGQAVQLRGGDPKVLRTLAASYAAAGDFNNAIKTARNAVELAEAQSNTDLASLLRSEITLYEAGQALYFAH